MQSTVYAFLCISCCIYNCFVNKEINGRKRRGKNKDLSEAGVSPQKWYYLKLLEEKKYENWHRHMSV
jgi:hypothetical protein